MSVRAKFTVESKTHNRDGSHHITLFPVSSGSEENKQFYKWTPSGSIQLNTINSAAADQFEVGKSYYLDFTPAES
jgi:hypothetical protein